MKESKKKSVEIQNGKGSKYRRVDKKAFDKNYNRIFAKPHKVRKIP